MLQSLKALPPNPDRLSSISRIRRKLTPTIYPLTFIYMWWHTHRYSSNRHTRTCMHAHIQNINIIKNNSRYLYILSCIPNVLLEYVSLSS